MLGVINWQTINIIMGKKTYFLSAIYLEDIPAMEKKLKPSLFGLIKGINPNNIYGYNYPLLYAAQEGRSKSVELLIQYGADVNLENKQGETALTTATHEKKINVAKLLLSKGADVNHMDHHGNTPLILAVKNMDEEFVELLLSHQASVDIAAENCLIEEFNGRTPLILAAGNGSNEIVNMLIAKGATIDAKNGKGETALLIATKNGYVEIVKSLLKAGADTTLINYDFQSPLQLAIENACAIETAYKGKSYIDIIKMLVLNGSVINKPYHSGDLPIKHALRLGHTTIAEWFIANGAIIDRKEKEKIEMERKNEEDLLRLGYYCATCGCYKSEQEVVEEPYEQDEWITIYYLYCRDCGSKITDKQGNWKISRVRN